MCLISKSVIKGLRAFRYDEDVSIFPSVEVIDAGNTLASRNSYLNLQCFEKVTHSIFRVLKHSYLNLSTVCTEILPFFVNVYLNSSLYRKMSRVIERSRNANIEIFLVSPCSPFEIT